MKYFRLQKEASLMNKDLTFSEFEKDNYEDWLTRVEKELRGAHFSKIVWKTAAGQEVDPYQVKHTTLPSVAGGKPGWKIRQDIQVSERSAEHWKNTGLDQVGFELKHRSPEFIERLLEANIEPVLKISDLSQAAESREGVVEFTPYSSLTQLTDWGLPNFKGGSNSNLQFTSDGCLLSNSGAHAIMEVAMALSQGHEILLKLLENGLSVTDAASKIGFKLSSGIVFYPELVKIRVLRLLWATIVRGYDNKSTGETKIHSTTSQLMSTGIEPHNNLLRTTTAAMAAVIGGTDSLEVLPYDIESDSKDSSSSRLARNIQNLLADEGQLGRVADAAKGSYFLDKLTADMADECWVYFNKLEKNGGYEESLISGFINEEIETSYLKQKDSWIGGETVVIGVNKYGVPNSSENQTGVKS
jgi:methylmalonyl-CoA mutase